MVPLLTLTLKNESFEIVRVGENANKYDLYPLVIHDCAIKLPLFQTFTMWYVHIQLTHQPSKQICHNHSSEG